MIFYLEMTFCLFLLVVIQGCPGECELNAPCVQCKAFQSGQFHSADPLCSQCPYPVHIVDELAKRPGNHIINRAGINVEGFNFKLAMVKTCST